MAATPKASWGWVKALLHSVYDQPDAASVHAQFDWIVTALADKLPATLMSFVLPTHAYCLRVARPCPSQGQRRRVHRPCDIAELSGHGSL